MGTLILLIGIGAVSAIEHNSSDESFSVGQTDVISLIEENNGVISVSENSSEILSAEDNDTVVSVSENSSEILSAEDNGTVVSVSENSSEILSVENSNTVVSVSNDDDLTSYSPFAKEPQMTKTKTQYKTLYMGKMKFLKKYKNMALYGYNIPSKKNKKAWRNHIGYQKMFKKQYKKWFKFANKVAKKAKANHWHAYGDLYYKLKYSGNYMYILFYADCYRTYKYNPLLNKGWWE